MPGFLCLSIFAFITSRHFSEKLSIALSCAISYLLISFVSFLRAKTFFKTLPNTPIINSAISICIGLILFFLLGILFTRKIFKEIMVKIFHRTPNDTIWKDVLDFENGSALKVYIRNEPYYIIGKHKNQEETGDDPWIALCGFGKFDKNTNENYNNEPSFINDDNAKYVIRFSDIEHIEIF